MSSCYHVFTHKCKKVELKHFQSMSNHHGAQYWIYNMLYTNFCVLKIGQKYFWNWLVELCSEIFLHWYIIVFILEVESA